MKKNPFSIKKMYDIDLKQPVFSCHQDSLILVA